MRDFNLRDIPVATIAKIIGILHQNHILGAGFWLCPTALNSGSRHCNVFGDFSSQAIVFAQSDAETTK